MAVMTSAVVGSGVKIQAFSTNTTVNDTTDDLTMTDNIDPRDSARMAAATRGDLFLDVTTVTGSPAVTAVVKAYARGKLTEIGRSSKVPSAAGHWRIPLTYETLSEVSKLEVEWESGTSLDGSNNFVVTAASSYYYFIR